MSTADTIRELSFRQAAELGALDLAISRLQDVRLDLEEVRAGLEELRLADAGPAAVERERICAFLKQKAMSFRDRGEREYRELLAAAAYEIERGGHLPPSGPPVGGHSELPPSTVAEVGQARHSAGLPVGGPFREEAADA